MGLREYLMNLAQAGTAAQNFRQATEPMAQADARALLGQAVPQALEQGDVGAAAGLSASVGEFGPLQSLISARAKSMDSPQESVIGEDQAKVMAQLFGDPSLAGVLAGRKESEAKGLIDLAAQGRAARFKATDQAMQSVEVSRRGKQFDARTIQNVLAPVKEADKKFEDEVGTLRNNLRVFEDKPTFATLQGLATALARASGQTGPLTQLDLDPFLMQTLQSSIVKAQNYLTGTNEALFDPNAPQVQELQRIGKTLLQAASESRLRKSRQGLERTIRENPSILEDSKGLGAIKDTAKGIGLEFDVEDRDGRRVGVFKGDKRVEAGLENSRDGDKTLDWTWVDKISDPEIKSDVLALKASGSVKTVEALQRLRANTQAILEGN